MTESPTTRPPAGRYGPEPTARSARRGRIGIVVAAVVGLALVVWIGLAMAGKPVSTKDVGFHVEGPQAVDVTFEVTKPKEATVTCRVTALSESYAEVGVRTVEVGPADAATRRVTVPVQTTELAVTGIVESCELVEDPTP
ncbi:DUF4307 domain-containing protein [Cellulomonas sp. Leaf334]|uniref:DUF4307 domain-containing protein n=1 Tax=Cellulomonas sp. Leaf334 TaxID=1736339 RepID=UPI0006F71B68|nr:DUF4307 domain-containing protein [Cellulomonas sp. Leaf334]KQR12454.1 secretion protein HlyD [Cellulomonas sp. Leaf334]